MFDIHGKSWYIRVFLVTGRCHPRAGKQALPAATAEPLRGSEADVRGQEPQGHRALGSFAVMIT